MDLCGCGAATATAATKEKQGWKQQPSKYDLSVVAGDSLTMAVTIDWEKFVAQYPSLYLTSQIRSASTGVVDGFFCDASSTPMTRDEILTLDDGEKILLHDEDDAVVSVPRLFTETNQRTAAAFSSKDFGPDFDTTGTYIGAQYIPLPDDTACRQRVQLALFPMMTRWLYDLSLQPDYEYIPCSHLPASANVPATATGYPPVNSYKAGKGWKSAIALPTLGGEYDSRTDADLVLGYTGVWDLQIASVDGRFARTVVSGTITVTGDVSRKVGVDE